MGHLPVLGLALLGFGVAFLSIPLILKLVARTGVGQRWDLHHTHSQPVPRYGGLALAVAFCVAEFAIWMVFPQQRARVPGRGAVIAGSLAMFALGFLDDLRPLGARKKLAGQILISLAVACTGVGIQQFQLPFTDTLIHFGRFGVVVTACWLVALTNLINLIDGVDGLAGGISLMLLSLLVYVGHETGSFVLLTAGMAGATLAFLCFNFPPAKIYLGDGGAYFLGFQIGLYAIIDSHKGSVVAALISPLFVLALPILDTAMSILRRGFRGLPLFRADRGHLHHRLLELGLSRQRVVLSFYGVTLVFLGMGFATFVSRDLLPVLLGVMALILLIGASRYGFIQRWLALERSLEKSLAIRQDVQYALCLAEWLKHEARRCETLDQLWQDFTFAAERLGFVSVRLTLGDAHREWQQEPPASTKPLHCERLDLRNGVLEFSFRRSESSAESQGVLQEIASELLAEAWMEGAKVFTAARQEQHCPGPTSQPSLANTASQDIS